ncbi:MAG: hypothetical protein JOY91_07840 [Sinobacteraceae bacterium]|nr:hypothetical protein [Nevskiaceae bacterium]
MVWMRRVPDVIRGLGPYALLELTLPGGSVIALAWWLAREHPLTDAWRRRLLAMLITLIAALALPVSALADSTVVPAAQSTAQPLQRLALAGGPDRAHPLCTDSTSSEARVTGDLLYQQGDYQHAAECYLQAGEPALADGAFLKAARPAGADTAHQFAQNGEDAKSQFRKIRDNLHHPR